MGNSMRCKSDYKHHYLPDCLLLEILYRLPAKSVFRFKCVSKHWLSLISDPSFLNNYVYRFKGSPPCTLFFRFFFEPIPGSPSNSYGIHYVTSNHSAFKSSNFPVPVISCSKSKQQPPPQSVTKKFQVLATSGDLLLFGLQGLFYVNNFFTKQWIDLPKPPCTTHEGLGLISRVKKGVFHYKVVLITHWDGYDVFNLQTFSSETGKWRKSSVFLPQPIMLRNQFLGAVSYNGILHWIDHQLGIIIAYDPYNNTSRCRLIELPMERENRNKEGHNAVLGVCQGRLRYFETYDFGMKPREFQSWSLWVLEDYDRGEWCLQHKAAKREICALDAHSSIHAKRRFLCPIAFHPLDLDIMYFWCHRGYIVTLNLRTGWLDEECYHMPDGNFICWWLAFPIVIPPTPTPIALPFWRCWNAITEKTVTERNGEQARLEF